MASVATHTIVRNVALIGHGHVGKTSLTDMLLYKAGVTDRLGSVDQGTSLLDVDDEERNHKLSTSAHLSHFTHHDLRINLIDTPGYPEFMGHVISALSAVETAVLAIDSYKGIEPNTRKSFALAGQLGLARMIVLTKCECENIDFDLLLTEIKAAFGERCVLMNVPVGIGSDFEDVVSTIHLPDEIPEGVLRSPQQCHQELVEDSVEADEELLMQYLDGEEIEGELLNRAVRAGVRAGLLIPIFCTSVMRDIGVSQFMDGLADYAIPPDALKRYITLPDGTHQELDYSEDAPLVAQVFKQQVDPYVSKLSYIRVFSGVLKKEKQLHDTRTKESLKIHQLFDMQGHEHQPVEQAFPGDLVAAVKVDDLKVGDTISDGSLAIQLPPMNFPTPMVGLAVEPKTRADQQKISGALHKIEDEDPTFTVSRDEQTHEIVIHGLSELHLSIIEERLKERDHVEIITHQPKIPYRETVTGKAEGSYRHKKQSGGSGQFAEVHMRVFPLSRDVDPEEYFTKENFSHLRAYHYDKTQNFAFLDCISGGSIPNQFIPAVEKGVRERLANGVLGGYPMQDIGIELFFGKDHPVDSNETAFRLAASHCLQEIAQQASPVLLEPIVSMEISVPEENMGDVNGDLNSRRGQVVGVDPAIGGMQVIRACAPLAEVTKYARVLQGITGGQGTFSMELSHYEQVPYAEQKKILAARSENEG